MILLHVGIPYITFLIWLYMFLRSLMIECMMYDTSQKWLLNKDVYAITVKPVYLYAGGKGFSGCLQ